MKKRTIVGLVVVGTMVALAASIGVTQTATNAAGTSATTYAGPATVGNSCGAVGSCSGGGTDNGVPQSLSNLAVSSDGVAISAGPWEENGTNIDLYGATTGYPLGESTGDSGPGSKGTTGTAMDSTYLYYALGNGQVGRSSRSVWMNPLNMHAYDHSDQTGVGLLTVDSGHPLLGMTLCDGALFVTDANGALMSNQQSPSTTQVDEIPTSLSGVTAKWSAPGASVLTCDKEGDIWVLVGLTSSSTGKAERFTKTGALVSSFTFPSSAIPQGIAADPTQDRLLVADNGKDQDFKFYNYSGSQTGQVGVTGGYLQGSDPGLIGAGRAVGPRSVAIDGSGDIYTGENCMPGVEQGLLLMGPCAIITKYQSDGSKVVWRNYNANTWGGEGEPTAGGSKFFDKDFEFKRDANGNYQPYAFTVNPWAYPSDTRVPSEMGDVNNESALGLATYTWDADGYRYVGTELQSPHVYIIYEQQPNSEILKPVYTFSQSAQDFFHDANGNIWEVAHGPTNVLKYPLTGYAADGTPQFGSAVNYGMPAQLKDVRRIEVEGSSIYLSGFSPTDRDNSGDWGNWISMGRTLVRYASLPTGSGSGWPSPTWQDTNIYTSACTAECSFPWGFAVNGSSYVGLTWLFDPNTHKQGELEVLNASNGSLIEMLSPPLSGARMGYFDNEFSVEAANGWFWLEDDFYTRIVGLCLSGACT